MSVFLTKITAVVDLEVCRDCPQYTMSGWAEICNLSGHRLEILNKIPKACSRKDAQRGVLVARKLMEA